MADRLLLTLPGALTFSPEIGTHGTSALSAGAGAMRWLEYHLHTLILFTYTDYKTIFLPVSAFAAVAAPVHSPLHLLRALAWTWLHLLQCNVSNQYKSLVEDQANRPWRPLPAGRISFAQARALRWALFCVCALLSLCAGWDVALVSVSLTGTMILYDEGGFAGHWLGKNLMNISGYVTFELGATKLMGASPTLDGIATRSVLLSAMIIFSMIQMQDFPDVVGDAALGRVTIPLRFPEGSRVFTAVGSLAWSVLLVAAWDLGPRVSALYAALGALIAWRNYSLRTEKDDSRSYLIFNAWLLLAHMMPLNARTGLLAW